MWWTCFWQLKFMCSIDRQLWCNPFWMVDTLWLAHENQGWVLTTYFHTMLSTTYVNEAFNFFITPIFLIVKLFLLVGCVKSIGPKVYRFLSWHIKMSFSCETLFFFFGIKGAILAKLWLFLLHWRCFLVWSFLDFFCCMNKNVESHQFHGHFPFLFSLQILCSFVFFSICFISMCY